MESNFNSFATAEIRFDIRWWNVRNEYANYPGSLSTLSTSRLLPLSPFSYILSVTITSSSSRRTIQTIRLMA